MLFVFIKVPFTSNTLTYSKTTVNTNHNYNSLKKVIAKNTKSHKDKTSVGQEKLVREIRVVDQ